MAKHFKKEGSTESMKTKVYQGWAADVIVMEFDQNELDKTLFNKQFYKSLNNFGTTLQKKDKMLGAYVQG